MGTILATATPARAAQWIPGHYGPYGHWHPAHWAGGGPLPPGPVAGPPPHRVWVPGWRGPYGAWHPGHWAVAP